MNCTICGGDGQQKVTVTVFGESKDSLFGNSGEVSYQDCIGCKGSGQVDEKRAAVLSYEQKMWCRCDEDHGVIYWKDGEHAILKKHHYRCRRCHKVVQIG